MMNRRFFLVALWGIETPDHARNYKYTIYSTPASGPAIKPLDPDIEIRP
jgi:hypothetical protein